MATPLPGATHGLQWLVPRRLLFYKSDHSLAYLIARSASQPSNIARAYFHFHFI